MDDFLQEIFNISSQSWLCSYQPRNQILLVLLLSTPFVGSFIADIYRHIANKGKNLPKHFGNLKCKAESINIFFISLLFSLSPFVSFVSFHFLLLKLGRCHSISFKVQSFISPAGALSPCQIVELGNEQQDISFFCISASSIFMQWTQ